MSCSSSVSRTNEDKSFVNKTGIVDSLVFQNINFNEIKDTFKSIKTLKHFTCIRCELDVLPIEILAQKSVLSLNLEGNNLQKTPDLSANFPDLEKLNLSANQFKDLPTGIKKLHKLSILKLTENHGIKISSFEDLPLSLQWLDLSSCDLTMLPENIASLKELKHLALVENNIEVLPETFAELSALEFLDLSYNYLGHFPASISSLSHLQELYLNHTGINNWSDLEEDLKELKILSLSNNPISVFPKMLQKMTQLESLDLSYCRISSDNFDCSALQQLKILHLEENALNTIPNSIFELKELQELTLSENKIHKVPANIKRLAPQLKRLDLSGIYSLSATDKQQLQLMLPDTKIYFE